MRVVAGTARGRRLVTPPEDAVRPTTDRVREAIFNSLGSLDAVVDAAVLDLCCGSGALGVEALSRGARSVTFVDSSPRSLQAVRENLAAFGFEDRATVVRADVVDHLAGSSERADLALADPPYAFDRWPELLEHLRAELLVIESDRPVDPGRWGTVLRERRYGGTVVTIARSAEVNPDVRPGPEDRT